MISASFEHEKWTIWAALGIYLWLTFLTSTEYVNLQHTGLVPFILAIKSVNMSI